MGCVDVVVVVVVVTTHSVIIIMDALDVPCIISFICFVGLCSSSRFYVVFYLENYVNLKKILRRLTLIGS